MASARVWLLDREGAPPMPAGKRASRQVAEYECLQCGWNGYRGYVHGSAPSCDHCGATLRFRRRLGALDPTWCDIVASGIRRDLLSADELFALDTVTGLRFRPGSMRPYVRRVEHLLRQGLRKREFARRLRPIITEGLRRLLTPDKKDKVRRALAEVKDTAEGQGDDLIHRIATAALLAMDDQEQGVADEDHPFFRYMFTRSLMGG